MMRGWIGGSKTSTPSPPRNRSSKPSLFFPSIPSLFGKNNKQNVPKAPNSSSSASRISGTSKPATNTTSNAVPQRVPFSARYVNGNGLRPKQPMKRKVVAAEDEGEFDHEEEVTMHSARNERSEQCFDDDDDAQSYVSTESKPLKQKKPKPMMPKTVRFQFQRDSHHHSDRNSSGSSSFVFLQNIKNGGEESRAPAEPEESEIERIRREKNEKKQRFKEWIRSTDSTVKELKTEVMKLKRRMYEMQEFLKRTVMRRGDIFFFSEFGGGIRSQSQANGLRAIGHPDFPEDDANGINGGNGHRMLKDMGDLVRPFAAVCKEVVDRVNEGVDGEGNRNRVNINFVSVNSTKTSKKVEINKNAPTVHQHQHLHHHPVADRDMRNTNRKRTATKQERNGRTAKRVFSETRNTNSSPFAGSGRPRKRQKTSSQGTKEANGWKSNMGNW